MRVAAAMGVAVAGADGDTAHLQRRNAVGGIDVDRGRRA